MEMSEEQRGQILSWFQGMVAKAQNSPKREANTRITKSLMLNNEDVSKFRKGMVRQFGMDPLLEAEKGANGKFPVREYGWSWKKFESQLNKQLREADTTGAFTQFLRAGIQSITIGMYESTKTSHEDWVTVVPSKMAEEPYAPHQGVAFPNQVGEKTPYPEVAAAALDLKLKNYKYGSMYNVTKELLEDDQTGEFQRQSGLLGEYLKILTEVLVMGKLNSVANQSYGGFVVPTTETKPSTETTYPWAQGLVGGANTKPASFGALSQANIQNGVIALMQQLNLLGLIMNVEPDAILISPFYTFDLAVLLHSAYYPSGAAASGSTGGAFAINPIQGIAKPIVSRYMFDNSGKVVGGTTASKAWYLIDSKKPWFVLQQRVPIAVEQENPMSGESFSRDIYRFKGYSRQNADFIDPRFAWQGSDGSV